jgi:hypothetical protein
MTRLIDAIPFLKGAVQRSMPGGVAPRYTFHDGRAYAQNAAILASYPVPHIGGTFALAADELEGALGRMKGEPGISGADGRMVLKHGKLRSSIDLMPCDPPDGSVDTNLNWEETPSGLFAALRTIQGFLAEEGTWQRTVLLQNGNITAFSNRSACRIAVPDLEVLDDFSLVDNCVTYLASLSRDPARWYKAGNGAALFLWPVDDLMTEPAWVRCQLSAVPWPDDIFDNIMKRTNRSATVELTQEWKDAFADIAALGDGHCEVRPDGLHGISDHGEHLVEFETGVERVVKYQIAALKPILACATAWDPAVDMPAFFSNASGTITGCIAGMRI